MICIDECVTSQDTKTVKVSIKTDGVEGTADNLTEYQKKLVNMYNHSDNSHEQLSILNNLTQSILSEKIKEERYSQIQVETKSGEKKATSEVYIKSP